MTEQTHKQTADPCAQTRRLLKVYADQCRVLEMLATGYSLSEVLDALVDLSERHCPGVIGSVLLLDEDRSRVRHAAGRRLPPGYARAIDGAAIGPSVGSCGTAMYTGKPVVVEDIQTDPLWADYRELAGRYGLSACWSHPIFASDGRVLGSFALYYRQPRRPEEAELELIRSSAHLAGIAIERTRDEQEQKRTEQRLLQATQSLEQEVADRTAELRKIASELVHAEDRERRRLAQVLHDNLQQLLVAARMKLEVIRVQTPDPRTAEQLEQPGELIQRAIQESRSLTAELSPTVLRCSGLAEALRWLAQRAAEEHGLTVELDIHDDANPSNPETASLLYQCVRELLFNVAKHAHTNEARLKMDAVDGRVRVCVEDHGRGFDSAAVTPCEGKGGFGLPMIVERLRLLGGDLNLHTAPGQGTRATINSPLGR